MPRMRWMLMALAALLLAACGKGEQPDPVKLASDGAAAFDQVSAFHFKLNIAEGEAAPLGDIILISADGNSLRPDKLKATLKAKLPGAPLAVNINGIIICADAWITPNPFNATVYEKLTETNGLESFSPAKGVSEVLRGLRASIYVEEAEIDSVKTHHISGVVDATSLNALTGGTATAGELKLDLWIGVDDKLLRQLVAVGPLDPSEKPGIKRTLVLDQFNAAVEITPPQ
jgi:lipoprotein LprG